MIRAPNARRQRLLAGLLAALTASAGPASAQVRLQGFVAPVSAPGLAPVSAAPSLGAGTVLPTLGVAAPSAVPALTVPLAAPIAALAAPLPAAAAALDPAPAAAASMPDRPRAASEAAAAPAAQVQAGRAAFDGAAADPRRAVQLETVGRDWDERNLGVARLPVVVGELRAKAEFSRLLRRAPRVQSMMIKEAGGDLKLPGSLRQFREAVAAAFAYERKINPGFDRSYAYLTVTQGPVAGGASQKRANAHTDGYPRRPEDRGPVDRMYLASDALPTEFFDQPFPVPAAADFAAIHESFEKAADPSKVVVHPDYTVTMMDAYTVHRSRKAERPEFRTFVQVHFSARRFEMAQNTPNPLLGQAVEAPAAAKLRADWGGYEARRRAAVAAGPVASDPKAFFARAFELGKLWWTDALLGHRMSLDAAAASGRGIARDFLEPKAPGAAAAYEAFAARARAADNPESPNAKRKRLAAALVSASLLPASGVVAYLDGLMSPAERS
ncbi:MAG TPA: hypothetical protein VH309_01170, partial [Elusimicrobiota bacterium]|nr:hypothetical protein [Elusimicrobiota bacterium]